MTAEAAPAEAMASEEAEEAIKFWFAQANETPTEKFSQYTELIKKDCIENATRSA